MAVRLRLRRIGKKKMPVYHIVAADSRAARNGKFLEVIGRYEPLQNPMVITTKEHRVFHWLKSGALPTDTVRSLLQRTGLWMKWSMTKKGIGEVAIAAEMEKWQLLQADRHRRDEERRQRRVGAARKAKKSGAAEPKAESAPSAETPVQAS